MFVPFVSVITPIFNRADRIHRVFSSMKAQEYQNIEHILIDDGSTDNIAEMVVEYIKEVNYPVRFYQKPNGGKHTAINIGWKLAKGEYIVHLDSDDELLPHALRYLVNLWKEIPENEKDSYWCVHGRCMDSNTRKLVGKLYPENANQVSFKDAKAILAKTDGDKIGMMRRDILSKYSYPEDYEVKFVTEAVVWGQINKNYRIYYSNEIVRIYYTGEENCLSNPTRNIQNLKNVYFQNYYRLSRLEKYEYTFKLYLIWMIQCKTFQNILPSDFTKRIGKKYFGFKNVFFSVLLELPCWLYSLYYVKRKLKTL